MLSFLMGKRKKRGERSRMGNNHSKIEEPGPICATSRPVNEDEISNEHQIPGKMSTSEAFRDSENIILVDNVERKNLLSKNENFNLPTQLPNLDPVAECSSERSEHINHLLQMNNDKTHETEVNESLSVDVKQVSYDSELQTTIEADTDTKLISKADESSETDLRRQQELNISCLQSIDNGFNQLPAMTASQVSGTVCTPESSGTLRDLERSRKAFFKGLLGETVEEIYPEDVNTVQIPPVTSRVNDLFVNETACTPALRSSDQLPECSNDHDSGTIKQQVGSGIFHANPMEVIFGVGSEKVTDSEMRAPEVTCGTDDMMPPGMKNESNIATESSIDSVHYDKRLPEGDLPEVPKTPQKIELNISNSPQECSVLTMMNKFDTYDQYVEPKEDYSDSECDDEVELVGDTLSLLEMSITNNSEEKVTDSGFGNDDNPELDEILHTELDEISLDEFDGTIGCEPSENICIDVVITEMKREAVVSDSETEVTCGTPEIGLELKNNSGDKENDVKLGELTANCVERCEGESQSDDKTREGLGNGLPGQQEGGLPAGPVHCAIPRDEHQVDMLTVRNGAYETFPRSNLSLSSSSDESIGTKVKKHVRWADTDDGRSLESYDSYSSSEEESGSEDEGVGVDQEIELAKSDPSDREEEADVDDDDENDSSESEEESDSEVEENKTGAEDTFTESDISVNNGEAEHVIKEDEIDAECEEDDDDEYEKAAEDETDSKTEESLVEKITRLQEELLSKATNLERAQNELDAAVLESDQNRRKIERLRDELDALKRKNAELQRGSDERSIRSDVQEQLERRIKELEDELETVRYDKNRLQDRLCALERERDHEIHMVQQALEAALQEQAVRESRYQKEFESERTLSSQRELQMLEDFEWKLRETEKNAKKKVENAEVESNKRVQYMEARLARAEADLERLAELKLCEIELKQLKVTSLEQRRNLRQITRQFEELQVNEKILQEEVHRLRAALDKEKQTVANMQVLHKEELAEKERKLQVKLDVQSSQLTSEWEDRLRRELVKLKTEMENTHREEKIVAVDMAKLLKEQEINALKQGWEKKSTLFKEQLANYKEKLEEKDSQHRLEIENAQTSSDRDALDLRRKMDKMDMEYQSKIEKMQEEHESELNECKLEYEKKIVQLEASYQLQNGTTRTTIELVKQQMMNENQARIERMQALHRQQMEEQWEVMEMERRKEVRNLEDCHRAALEQLRKELDEIRKVGPSPPNSVIGSFFRYFSQAVAPNSSKQANRQRTPVPETAKQIVLDQLNHEATNPFSCGDLDEIEAVSTGSDAEKILFAKLQQMARQAHEDKIEIEKLRHSLEEKENSMGQATKQTSPSHQARQQQHPPHPSRRNRKRRN